MPESEYTLSRRRYLAVAGLVRFIPHFVAIEALLVAFLATPTRAASASGPISQFRDAVVDLGSLRGDVFSAAFAISDSRRIAGRTSAPAVSWRNGAITDLGAPPVGSDSLRALGVNNREEFVGDAFTFTTGTVLPYFWPRGAAPQVLLTPGVANATAHGVNDLGEIAG
jgi:hypothetical protein